MGTKLTGEVVMSGHMTFSDSWWHEVGDERSISGRSVCHSCIFQPRPSATAR